MTIERALKPILKQATKTDPVVILEGARAVGKTTLAKQMVAENVFVEYRTFTDTSELKAAQDSPSDYIGSLPFGTVIDEAQLVEDITLPIKELIDRDPKSGRFLLTGSSRLRRSNLGGSDPLAGRAQTPFTLYPLTWSEVRQNKLSVVDNFFERILVAEGADISRPDIAERMSRGGLPGFLDLDAPVTRANRFEQYFRSVTELPTFEGKDLRLIESLFRFLSSSTGTLVNVDKFSKAKEINRATTKSYLDLFNEALLTVELPGWRAEAAKSELQTPKLHIADSGLAGAMGRLQPQSKFEDFGKLFETFVVLQILAHATWSERRPKVYHWRYKQRNEIDIILEDHLGQIVCVKMKSSSTITQDTIKHIEAFKQKYTDRFVAGYVIYTGNKLLPFSKNIWAMPVSHLAS